MRGGAPGWHEPYQRAAHLTPTRPAPALSRLAATGAPLILLSTHAERQTHEKAETICLLLTISWTKMMMYIYKHIYILRRFVETGGWRCGVASPRVFPRAPIAMGMHV